MAQIPNLQSTNTLGTDDQAILRQGTIDKRISLNLAGILSWATREGYSHIGEHTTGSQFPDTQSFTTYQGRTYFVNDGVTLPYTSSNNDPSLDTNLYTKVTPDYKGLWPDTSGSANKGETWQTQTGGTPTGQYFTALQNTTITPVSDNVNWRSVVSNQSIGGLTSYQSENVADMIAGNTISGLISHNENQVWSTKYHTSKNYGGGATYDVVLTSSVTPNGIDAIQSLADPSLSFVLRKTNVVNLVKWGYLPDDSTDNSPILDRVEEYLKAKLGGIILLPSKGVGLHSTNFPLISFTRIQGPGKGIFTIKAHPTSTDNVMGTSGNDPVDDFDRLYIHLEGFSIDGNRSNVSWNLELDGDKSDDAFQNGIRLFKCKEYTIKDVEIQNTVFNGLSVYFLSSGGYVDNITTSNIGKVGAPPAGSFATYWGIFVEYAGTNLTINNPRGSVFKEGGILIQTATDGGISDLVINNPILTESQDGMIRIKDQGSGGTGPLFNIDINGGKLLRASLGATEAALRVQRISSPSTQAANVTVNGTYIQDSNYIGLLFDTGTASCKAIGVEVYGSADKGIVNAGTDNALSSCTSLNNVSDNFDDSAGSRTRLSNNQFKEAGGSDGEYGSFTPVLLFGGNSDNMTYASRSGSYSISNGYLHFEMNVILSGKGTSTGNATLGGLPYAAENSTPLGESGFIPSNVTFGDGVGGLILQGATDITLRSYGSGSAISNLTDANFVDNSELYVSGKVRLPLI
ncbi:coil containing protein [Vibrio phage 1.187.O._10N.286.49.F1]|nr:coil containing protein [Vibrio phage 1.187.O._10N.286.49.F1]